MIKRVFIVYHLYQDRAELKRFKTISIFRFYINSITANLGLGVYIFQIESNYWNELKTKNVKIFLDTYFFRIKVIYLFVRS